MLKLVLNSVNVDLGWGSDKCYSKVKDMSLAELLSDEPRDKDYNKNWQLGDPVVEHEHDVLLDGRLEYYVFDVYFDEEDIPALDVAMSNIKTVLDRDALVLFDSYANYVKAKETGARSFKLVTGSLADYDWASNSVIKLVDTIYVKKDTDVNLVVYDYVNKCLQTIPFTSIRSKDTAYDDMYLFNSVPMLYEPPYVPSKLCNEDCPITLAVLKTLYYMCIIGKGFVVIENN